MFNNHEREWETLFCSKDSLNIWHETCFDVTVFKYEMNVNYKRWIASLQHNKEDRVNRVPHIFLFRSISIKRA